MDKSKAVVATSVVALVSTDTKNINTTSKKLKCENKFSKIGQYSTAYLFYSFCQLKYTIGLQLGDQKLTEKIKVFAR